MLFRKARKAEGRGGERGVQKSVQIYLVGWKKTRTIMRFVHPMIEINKSCNKILGECLVYFIFCWRSLTVFFLKRAFYLSELIKKKSMFNTGSFKSIYEYLAILFLLSLISLLYFLCFSISQILFKYIASLFLHLWSWAFPDALIHKCLWVITWLGNSIR